MISVKSITLPYRHGSSQYKSILCYETLTYYCLFSSGSLEGMLFLFSLIGFMVQGRRLFYRRSDLLFVCWKSVRNESETENYGC